MNDPPTTDDRVTSATGENLIDFNRNQKKFLSHFTGAEIKSEPQDTEKWHKLEIRIGEIDHLGRKTTKLIIDDERKCITYTDNLGREVEEHYKDGSLVEIRIGVKD